MRHPPYTARTADASTCTCAPGSAPECSAPDFPASALLSPCHGSGRDDCHDGPSPKTDTSPLHRHSSLIAQQGHEGVHIVRAHGLQESLVDVGIPKADTAPRPVEGTCVTAEQAPVRERGAKYVEVTGKRRHNATVEDLFNPVHAMTKHGLVRGVCSGIPMVRA